VGVIRKTSRWVFIRLPARIVGTGHMANNHAVIRDLFRSLTNPQCPDCRATLTLAQQAPNATEQTWYCQRCSFAINSVLSPRDLSRFLINEYVLPVAQAQATHFFTDNDSKTLLRQARRHERGAWTSLAAMTALLAYLIYAVATNHPLLQLIGIAAMVAPLSAYYLKYRYRGWQIRHRKLFQPNGFLAYVKSGQWCSLP
jgi:hypothetical protein